MSSRDILDRHHDDLARALVPGCTYESKDGSVVHVVKIDNGSEPGEFGPHGRRPAQAKVIVIARSENPTFGLKEGTTRWIVGREIEWLVLKVLA